jgi:hypothetical protein
MAASKDFCRQIKSPIKCGMQVEIKIDDPREYITQTEGTYGLTPMKVGPDHGPFGGVLNGATKFISEFRRIVGFFGRCALALDSIGCYTIPVEV